MRAAATKVIVRKGRLNEKTTGGVVVPNNVKQHVNLGLVLDIGHRVSAFELNAQVVMFMAYHQSSAWDDLETKEGIVVLDEVAVMATFDREEAEARFNVTFEPLPELAPVAQDANGAP